MSIYNAIMDFTNWGWSLPILIVLIGGGIWLTVACDFIQFKHFGKMIKLTIGQALKSDNDKNKISSLQAVTAALAATLGTGNIVGVGTAIAMGGPGAVFWMWIIGMVAMALKYAEATLAVQTREVDENGEYQGGAFRYLTLINKPLGYAWVISFLVALWIAAGVHTGSVVSAAEGIGISKLPATIAVVLIIAVVLFGGLKVLIKITDKLVPFMATLYVVAGLVVVILNIQNLLPALASIFQGAFRGTAAVGGFTGASVTAAIRYGCARGMYSSDAGNGQSSLMHAQADVDDPVRQGLWGVFEVFVDTIIVCTFTALVILCTGVWESGELGSTLAISAFTKALGNVGLIISSMGLVLFAGSTVLAFCTYVGMVAKNIFGNVAGWVSQILFIILAFVGGTVGVDKMLLWADFASLFTITLNVIGMLIMTKTLRKLTKNFFKYGNSKGENAL